MNFSCALRQVRMVMAAAVVAACCACTRPVSVSPNSATALPVTGDFVKIV